MGALDKVNGSIQSEVQRARGRAIVATGEFAGGSGLTDGWDQGWNMLETLLANPTGLAANLRLG
jgi:hypothetical protein